MHVGPPPDRVVDQDTTVGWLTYPGNFRKRPRKYFSELGQSAFWLEWGLLAMGSQIAHCQAWHVMGATMPPGTHLLGHPTTTQV